jgi:hypothetical protein
VQDPLAVQTILTAAFIATSDAWSAAAAPKTLRFWQLYWSVMGMVEAQRVSEAMIAFGGKLNAKESPSSFQAGALQLALACRREMGDSWSPIWRR